MTLGLIVPDLANPVFSELVHAVLHHASDAGYALLVGDALNDGSQQEAWIRTFIQRQVDGVILLPANTSADGIAILDKHRIPWISALRPPAVVSKAPLVTIANREGAYEATAHLLGHGRKRIACIAGPERILSASERAAGWRLALEANDLTVDKRFLAHAPFTPEAGYREATRLLGLEPLDAFFCASDAQAIGVLEAIRDLGLRCPEDVAVVSFDGILAGGYLTPSLSTMATPLAEIGRSSVERLLEEMQHPDRLRATTVLPVQLIRRGSCGCPTPHLRDLIFSSGDTPAT